MLKTTFSGDMTFAQGSNGTMGYVNKAYAMLIAKGAFGFTAVDTATTNWK